MIKTKIKFEKKNINKNNNEQLMLLELIGEKKDVVNKNKKTLNLSLAIDVSGSMGNSIDGQNYRLPNNFFGKSGENIEIRSFIKKLDLVKKAACIAVENLSVGDFISIITFDDKITIVSEAEEITENNKKEIIKKINNINEYGMTDLHSGWLEGVNQVSKNYNNDFLNRVILLTDGQINVGERNEDIIVSDVLNVYNNNISISCFGVGSDFNENLLSAMSDSGGGNFYYIDKEEDISDMFLEEFDGISNVCAFNTKLKLSLSDNIEVIENYNNYKINEDGLYLLPNITKNKLSILFKLKINNINNGLNELGYIELVYKDENAKNKKNKKSIKIEAVDNEEWQSQEENKEVKIQELLLSVAINKLNARKAMESGDKVSAKNILRSSHNLMANSNITDNRISEETNVLSANLDSVDSTDSKKIQKDLLYQSYITRTNK